MIALAIITGAVLLSILFLYNTMISKKNEVDNAFAGIDVQLTKRYDLIPNLIGSVKQYMAHERGILEQITKLRTEVLSVGRDSNKKIELDNQISAGLSQIMVAVENYPDLKASANFDTLMKSLNEVEEQLSAARRAFNAVVTDYNNAVEMIPTSIMASIMGLKRKELFVSPIQHRENINVSKLFNS